MCPQTPYKGWLTHAPRLTHTHTYYTHKSHKCTHKSHKFMSLPLLYV